MNRMMSYEEAKTFCMSYAPTEWDGVMWYSEQDVLNMLQNIYGEDNG